MKTARARESEKLIPSESLPFMTLRRILPLLLAVVEDAPGFPGSFFEGEGDEHEMERAYERSVSSMLLFSLDSWNMGFMALRRA